MLQYIISLTTVSIFYILIISLLSLMTTYNVNQFIWTVWFIGVLLLFYGFIASLLWEFVFHFIQFKTLWSGGSFYLFLGAICGGITTAIVHLNIGEATVIVWIGTMVIIGIAALIFYTIRRIPHHYR